MTQNVGQDLLISCKSNFENKTIIITISEDESDLVIEMDLKESIDFRIDLTQAIAKLQENEFKNRCF